MTTIRATFPGHDGAELAARLDVPETEPRAWAVFAHCFTCSKDVLAARRIGAELARLGLGVLRFDFTGLGGSGGEFASTHFSSNVEDLKRACAWLAEHHGAPSLLVGHSLGGAAVLCAAGAVPSVAAVATIGAPSDVAHVLHQFGGDLDAIEREGRADVNLAGRAFTIARSFVEDARAAALAEHVRRLGKPLLVMHSPVDETVGIDNASEIFLAARHPKSFVSLDDADHLLTRERDARFAASVISGWADRYLPQAVSDEREKDAPIEHVRVSETGNGKFQQVVQAGRHRFLADEPVSYGGDDTGPTPYDLLAAGLGACTTMTLRMYADRKGLDWSDLSVDVSHAKVHAADCAECSDEQRGAGGRIDRFERVISLRGTVDEAKVLEIADKCPVHRTLHAGAAVATRIE